jgi:hypothetical protein
LAHFRLADVLTALARTGEAEAAYRRVQRNGMPDQRFAFDPPHVMRLFRQSDTRDWHELAVRMAEALRAWRGAEDEA